MLDRDTGTPTPDLRPTRLPSSEVEQIIPRYAHLTGEYLGVYGMMPGEWDEEDKVELLMQVEPGMPSEHLDNLQLAVSEIRVKFWAFGAPSLYSDGESDPRVEIYASPIIAHT